MIAHDPSLSDECTCQFTWPPCKVHEGTNWTSTVDYSRADREEARRRREAAEARETAYRRYRRHLEDSQEAFRRPRRRQGRGTPPEGKWTARRPKRRSLGPGRRRRVRR